MFSSFQVLVFIFDILFLGFDVLFSSFQTLVFIFEVLLLNF